MQPLASPSRRLAALGSRIRARFSICSVLNGAVSVLAVLFTLYTIYYAYTLMWVQLRYSNLFLGLGLALFYLEAVRSQYEARLESDTSTETDGNETRLDRLTRVYTRLDPFVALSAAILALVATGYVEYHFDRLDQDVHLAGFTSVDILVGTILILLAIDATRRAFGNVIAGVAVASVGYAHDAVGPMMPGVFYHSGFDWNRIVREGAISLNGVYDSTLMGIGSTWVAIFIMFAGIAKGYGLMDFVLDVGREVGKSLRTGVVQIAVVSSMVMGSITGSAAANTATTGSFTIPLLKEQGVRDDFAAAIEAVASAGGQMLPPVMGVAAFLMVDMIGISYVEVIRAGVIPAALFYFSVCVAVHFSVLKFGWTSPNTGSFDARMLLRGVHFAVPLVVLLVALVVLQYTPLYAGLYAIATIVLVGSVKTVVVDCYTYGIDSGAERSRKAGETFGRAGEIDEDRSPPLEERSGTRSGVRGRVLSLVDSPNPAVETLKTLFTQLFVGLKKGGLEMAPLVGVLAAMGLIVGMLTETGLAQSVSTNLVGLGGGVLVVVLVLAMIASIMFGLGMPTPAAYVLVVLLVAPGITEMGVPELTTHMFVFYFAMLSAITPPVAISVAIGSRISGTSFVTACVQALRIGAPGFLIPFAFVTNNSLITWTQMTPITFPVVLAGTVALIVATVGFDGARDLSFPVRTLYGIAAFGAMFGSIVHIGVQIVAATAIVSALAHAKFVVGYDLDSRTNTEEPTAAE